MPKKLRTTPRVPRRRARRVTKRTTLKPASERAKRAAAVPDNATVRINLPGQTLLSLPANEPRYLQRQAIRWSYALRNRERWNTQSAAVREQQDEIRKVATALGFQPQHFERMAEAGIVEIDIPWTEEQEHWELRIFPWEFMLASAASLRRGGHPLTVVRHLRVARTVKRVAPTTWLQVLSAPGKLSDQYDFESEKKLLEVTVQSIKGSFHILKDPDEAGLRRGIITHKPHVVHLSGFDSHQGLALLGGDRSANELDGYLIRSTESEPYIDAERLADILTSAPGLSPTLIACNFYNSAGRIAPLCVAKGAGSAIGFQDSFDDELAELFFTTLYQAWSLAKWDLAAAFQFAWQAVADQKRPLQGSAVVLWSEHSILRESPAAEKAPDARREQIRAAWSKRSLRTPTAATVRQDLDVEVEPIPQLNYSILHNNGPIFRRFRVRKQKSEIGRVDDLFVSVELHVGTDSYPFRLQISLEERASHLDLQDQVRMSLASTLSRAIRESIHTNLFVEVRWQESVMYRQTHRVTLLPVDEWRFDPSNYRWLPSFVLPRDPAVLRVVDAAQRYLMALRDDAKAGFDGYQCVEPAAAGRKQRPEECALVDMQVRAIWSALLYEAPLSYINPPPSFTESSQRLRTPSDCIDGKRGTCIDLALLMASCLEYVEIYPAIFLLRTHAFPAYWRHDSFHEAFRVARTASSQADEELAGSRPTSAAGQLFAWDFQAAQYREILGEIQAGHLVPLETTLVTGYGSFADAVAGGVQNLANRREFESMLDILLARTDEKTSVTPLPIRRAEA